MNLIRIYITRVIQFCKHGYNMNKKDHMWYWPPLQRGNITLQVSVALYDEPLIRDQKDKDSPLHLDRSFPAYRLYKNNASVLKRVFNITYTKKTCQRRCYKKCLNSIWCYNKMSIFQKDTLPNDISV